MHSHSLTTGLGLAVPEIVSRGGQRVFERYLLFFAGHIRNTNTRAAYLTAVIKFFGWCETHRISDLGQIQRLHVAAYVEQLTHLHSAPTVKQNLAALRMFFSYLQVPQDNPTEGVRGPKHSARVGKTPVLSAEQARHLLNSIPADSLAGLRDRALIALMIYSFARVSAVVGMEFDDYYLHGTRRWIRLREKGGKEHTVPVHHRAEEYVDAYIATANISGGPLFRTLLCPLSVTQNRLNRLSAWEMVKRRAKLAGLPEGTTSHSCRATGITVYLQNGGTIENARNIAAHASIKTTQMYDRRGDAVTLEEINRIHL